jgi:ribosomal protein S18 acetylase RimI-like enzyme
MRSNLSDYIDISADVSDWGEAHFLKDLPRKWELSFAAGTNGYCILSERNDAIHINQLMVARDRRGQGLGAAMLAEAVRRGATTLKVHPDNLGATRFYRRHGWRVTATENGYLVMTIAQ